MTFHAYSPSHSLPADLEAITVDDGRKAVIETLVSALADEALRTRHQNHLLVAPRGSGKTHTLALVVSRLLGTTGPGATPGIACVTLPEEVVVRRATELPLVIAERWARDLGSRPSASALRDAVAMARRERDDTRLLSLAMDAIETVAESEGVVLVAVVENLDRILFSGAKGTQSRQQGPEWALRARLQSSPRLVILGAAPSLFGSVLDSNAAFYGHFRHHELAELSQEAMLALFRTRVERELRVAAPDSPRGKRLFDLESDWKRREPALRALLTFTGGLPRVGHLVFDLLVTAELDTPADLLSRFLDEQTPYFQSQMDPRVLPAGEAVVLDALASAPSALSASVIADGIGDSPNAVAVALQRLRDRGLVKESREGRSVLWDVAEPLLRVWRRFRIGRAEEEQALVLAEFVAALFSGAELRVQREGIVRTGGSTRALRVMDEALKLSDARYDAGRAPSAPGTLMARLRKAEVAVATARTGAVPELATAIKEAAEAAHDAHELDAALRYADEGIRIASHAGLAHESARIEVLRARTLGELGHTSQSLEALQLAQAKLQQLGDLSGSTQATLSMVGLWISLDNLAEAKDACDRALDVGRDEGMMGVVWEGLVERALVELLGGEPQTALSTLEEALSTPNGAASHHGTANAMIDAARVEIVLGRFEASLSRLNQASTLLEKMGDNFGVAWVNVIRGEALLASGQPSEALLSAQKSLRTYDSLPAAQNQAIALGLCAQALSAMGKEPDAHEHFLKALRLELATQNWRNAGITARELLQRIGAAKAPRGPRLRDAARLLARPLQVERTRQTLLDTCIALTRDEGPKAVLDVLPSLEAALPESHLGFLRPLRLAAEVLAGTRPESLRGEPTEMRRAVALTLQQLSAS